MILALKILSLSRAKLLPLQHNELPEKMSLWEKKAPTSSRTELEGLTELSYLQAHSWGATETRAGGSEWRRKSNEGCADTKPSAV